ncbi:hypothetical protein PANT_13c00044 [Moesziomyces antarcticus T-34]|uniref:Uncharacterized protein n=1 Tax=Pseudozyma antarctica (strain T-34) TaxID=1151754 RepID=M9MDZ9_PSEA3|nr:hypothetical protein PANT_13c00044 [Moesziomyces antarcticus T-34]
MASAAGGRRRACELELEGGRAALLFGRELWVLDPEFRAALLADPQPSSSSALGGAAMAGHRHRSHRLLRRHARQPDSLLVKHHTLFRSLSRYADENATTTVSTSAKAASRAHAAALQSNRITRLKQSYPVAYIWTYSWPRPPSEHPTSSVDPKTQVDEAVARIVADCFEREYERFRTPEYCKEHRISKEHRDQIVIDANDVETCAAAAQALVHTAITRFTTAANRGLVGKRPQKIAEAASTSDGTNEARDAEKDAAELDQEVGRPQHTLGWQELLDFFHSTVGNSAAAQWRNWHLIEAIARTRLRCKELFPHESS